METRVTPDSVKNNEKKLSVKFRVGLILLAILMLLVAAAAVGYFILSTQSKDHVQVPATLKQAHKQPSIARNMVMGGATQPAKIVSASRTVSKPFVATIPPQVSRLVELSQSLEQATYTCHDFDVLTQEISSIMDSDKTLTDMVRSNLQQVVVVINSQAVRCYPQAEELYQKIVPDIIALHWKVVQPSGTLEHVRKWLSPYVTIREKNPSASLTFENHVSAVEQSLEGFQLDKAIEHLRAINHPEYKPIVPEFIAKLSGFQMLLAAIENFQHALLAETAVPSQPKENQP